MDFETYKKELEEERKRGEKIALIHAINVLSGKKGVLTEIENPKLSDSYNDLLTELNMLANGLTQR